THQFDKTKKENDEETELKTPIKTNKNEILNEVVEKFSQKTKSPLKEAVLNATLGKDVAKETIKETLNVKDFMQKEFTQKETSKENLKDVKLNHLSEGLKITSENLTKVVQNKTSENLFSELLNKETNKELFTKENGENTANTEKSGIDDLNNLVKDLSRVNQNQKIISPKETLQYFSKDLKEAMEQYKAPITKLSITLNPSNLGEVEVTLVQRGANLHINFNSNHNAMNLFLQHQAEFKNSLVNMGFTGLEMNFSDQGKKEQQQEKKSKSHYYEENFEEESGPKINLELVLAKYF
ncbi:flagellar hook-length control protein FliK, partial [Campylobacter upsaliensis]